MQVCQNFRMTQNLLNLSIQFGRKEGRREGRKEEERGKKKRREEKRREKKRKGCKQGSSFPGPDLFIWLDKEDSTQGHAHSVRVAETGHPFCHPLPSAGGSFFLGS